MPHWPGMAELVAVITAGGRVDGAFADLIGTSVKALAPIGDRLLIDAALDAARAAGATRIGVVGPAAVLAHCEGRIDEAIPEKPTGEENLRSALATARGATLLLLTSDLPFVTAHDVTDFMERARESDAAMPLSDAAAYDAAFPAAPPHVVTLGGERVANGSVFFFAPGSAPRVSEIAERLFTARKSLGRMAVLLGPALLGKFVVRRLRIEDIEARAQRVFGLRIRAIRDAAPGLCYDVDTQADYTYALERLAGG